MKRAKVGVVLFVLFAATAPGLVAAQPATDEARSARARELFTEGVTLAGQQQYAEAATRFREALTLRDAPAIRYNLASTLYEERQFTEAHEIAAALLALPDLPESVRTPTAALELQIGAAAGFVTAEIPDGISGDVQVDDTPVTDPSRAMAVTPGRHTVRVVRDGTIVAEGTIEVGSGVRRTVALEPVTPGAHDSGPEGPVTDQWWFWTAIGGGVVVLGVIVGVAAGVADHDAHAPVQGNFSPSILSW